MRTLSLLLLLAAAACRAADTPSPPATLAVHDAWARSADSGMVTAVYFTLTNPEPQGVVLVSASSPLAESVSLHMTHEMNGMVHMMPLDSAAVPSGDSLVLAESARHLMVNGLRRKLAAGDSLPVTLQFAGGRALEVKAAVRSPY
ncbi:MAG: copper chaperone PCu(A)C [Gemmatimonadaceae bacterium]|nr:copper chaperone PCu(A)C [Gemmatimonadaceae bacterium]